MSDSTSYKYTMTKTEAKEIRTLIKSEYAFLDQELGGQVARIKSDIRSQIDAEEEAALVSARKRIDSKIRAKADKLKHEAHELLRELQEEGFILTGYRQTELFDFQINDNSLSVGTAQKRRDAAFSAVDTQASEARRNLKLQENEAVRKLTLNLCDTEEAREFVQNIPTLASLIQMPNMKQLGN